MAKSVPFQTAPEVQLTSGSEVQFSGGQVRPSEDVVSGAIKNQSQAILNTGKVLSKLDDEINDAESKMLYNDLHGEIQNVVTNYGNLKGADAVKVTNKETNTTAYDDSNKAIEKILEDKKLKSRNGMVKFLVENMAQTTIKDAQDKMLKHSLVEQNKYNLSETETKRDIHKANAQINYKSYAVPGGPFQTQFSSGLNMIDEIAKLKNWNTDPNAIGPDGKKLGVSSQYLNALNEYTLEVFKDVIDKFGEDEDSANAKKLITFLEESVNKQIANNIAPKVEEQHTAIKNEKVCDAILNNNGNQNDGNYINVVNKTLCLSSNHSFENGVGGTVNDGLDSSEDDTTNKKQTENIELLEQKRSQSKFFNIDSTLAGTLLLQHEPIHMYAIEKIGVNKADSLYTKAEREYELPEFENKFPDTKAGRRKYDIAKKKFEEEFSKNPDNENIIKAAILDKYIELIIDEHENKFNRFYGATKDTYPNAPKREDFEDGAGEAKKYREARKEFFSNPENIVKVNPDVDAENLETMTGRREKVGRYEAEQSKIEKEEKFQKYQDKVANDLQVLKNGVDYNAIIEKPKVDFITGLRSLSDLKKEVKATITDKKEQEVALKDLEVKYNKIAEEKTAIYNDKRNAAIEIAYAEPNGWKNLAANGIKIDDFTEEDQAIFKEGPPEESNIETVAELDSNPIEVRDNIDAHRHQLNPNTFLQLKRYSEQLKSNEDKVIEASGDVSLLKDVMYKNGYTWVYGKLKGNNAALYHGINVAWVNRIDEVQRKTKQKLDRVDKERLLRNVLLDKVNLDGVLFLDKSNVQYSSLKEDQFKNVFVLVNGERIFGSNIDKDVKTEIKRQLYLLKKPMNEQQIAERWVQFNKPETLDIFKETVKNLTK